MSISRKSRGHFQHDGDEPNTLVGVVIVVPPVEDSVVEPGTGVVPGRVPGPGIPKEPGPVQGRPVNEFLPNGGASIVMLGAGETGTGGSWVTVFPLSLGLVVLPLSSGLLVFCASAIVILAVKTSALSPTSSMRFTAMSDLLVVAPSPIKY